MLYNADTADSFDLDVDNEHFSYLTGNWLVINTQSYNLYTLIYFQPCITGVCTNVQQSLVHVMLGYTTQHEKTHL